MNQIRDSRAAPSHVHNANAKPRAEKRTSIFVNPPIAHYAFEESKYSRRDVFVDEMRIERGKKKKKKCDNAIKNKSALR